VKLEDCGKVLNISQADIFQNVSKNNNSHIRTKDTSSGSDNQSKAETDKREGGVVPLQATKVYGKRKGIALSRQG
jgi:hypothetical protein